MRIKTVLKLLCFAVVIGALVLAGFKLYSMVQREFLYKLKYETQVKNASEEFGLSEGLVFAVIRTESDFDANAVSPAGARGLMQLMPETYQWLCGITGEEYAEEKLFEPETNIRYGCLFLSQLYRQFTDTQTVLAAYNAGQGTVISWLKDESISPGGTLVNIPYPETSAYVAKVKDAANIYENLYLNEKGWNPYVR